MWRACNLGIVPVDDRIPGFFCTPRSAWWLRFLGACCRVRYPLALRMSDGLSVVDSAVALPVDRQSFAFPGWVRIGFGQ